MALRATTPHPPASRGNGAIAQRYQSLFAVGHGGMGSVEVALARDDQRIVALKRMLPAAARDTRLIEMFLREARVAALLSHPNVVHAYAYGELEGELFLAMEYVAGEQLSKVVRVASEREGQLRAEIAAYVLAAVCDGLHAAHELRDEHGAMLNVIHRDISPHNVMIAYDGSIKLLDFGVAKVDTQQGVTRTGEVKGKTAYMSPEQAMGEAIDRRSDLFSVGAVLFECISGHRMWGNGTDLEVLRKLALEAPPRLDAAAPQAPKELCALHARLVSREPSCRPESARAVAQELRAWLAQARAQVDGAHVGAMMQRLFEHEANARREALDRALRAPSSSDEPAATLEATVSELGDEPESMTATSLSPRALSKQRRITASVVGALLLGAMLVVAASRRPASRAEAAAVTASSAASTGAPSASAAGNAMASASASPAPKTIAPTTTQLPSWGRASAPPPRATAKPARPASHTKPRAPASGGKVDVDPEPF